MQKLIWGVIILLVVVAGGWYFYSQGDKAASAPADATSNAAAGNVSADAGDQPTGSRPDASLVVGESIIGKWQDTTDAKNAIEFKSGDQVVWWYDNKELSNGLFVVFTKDNAPKVVSFPIDTNSVYLQTTSTGSQSDTQNFKVSLSADTNTLTLTYMDRGGATTYKRVQ